MLFRHTIKFALIGFVTTLFTTGCASKTQVNAIEDQLSNHSVGFISIIQEESFVLQKQIEFQKEQLDSVSSQIEQLEQKLRGVRFRITPTVIQLLHDYDEVEQLGVAQHKSNSCSDMIYPGHSDEVCGDYIASEPH